MCLSEKGYKRMQKKIIEAIRYPNKVLLYLVSKNVKMFEGLSDEKYLRLMFRLHMGTTLHLSDPKSFNEKLQWLKIHDRNHQYNKMVDKYEVKAYVSDIIGSEYIIPTIGVWDSFDEIDFSDFPKQFVLKCTHDSGGVIIVKEKANFDIEQAKKRIETALNTNYYYWGREWPYKDVKPRIMAEPLLDDGAMNGLIDYKVHVFNGTAKTILVCQNRASNLVEDFYSTDWVHLDVKRKNHPNAVIPMEKPKELDLMIKLAETLSKGIPFLRVDFYIVKGKVYFGELTFFPASGMERFIPDEFDISMGEWLDLSNCIAKNIGGHK